MTADDATALIDDLAIRPTEESWSCLCLALAEVPTDALETVLAHAETRLESWPVGLRTIDPRSTPAVALPLGRTLAGGGSIPALPDAPTLTRVAWHQVRPADMKTLSSWSGVTNLEEVAFSDLRDWSDGAAAVLFGALDPETVTGFGFEKAGGAAEDLSKGLAPFTGLRSLALGGFGDAARRALAGATWWSQLESFELDTSGLDEPAVLGTLELLAGANLRRLVLRGKIGSAVAEGIGARFTNLEELDICVLEGGLAAFCEAAGTAALRDLTIASGSKTTKSDIAALAGWAGASSLKALRLLRARSVDDRTFATLARSEHLGGLEEAVFTDASFGDEGLEAWAERETASLRRLRLELPDLGDDGMVALAASPGVAGLEALAVRDNEVGDKGAKALAASPHLGRLRELDLTDSHVGLAGVKAIVESDLATHIEVLRLDSPLGKAMGSKGADVLAQAPLTRLQSLSIVAQKIPIANVLSSFGKSKALTGLIFLDVSHNPKVANDGDRIKRALRGAGLNRLQHVRAEVED